MCRLHGDLTTGGRVEPQTVAITARKDKLMHFLALDDREPQVVVTWRFVLSDGLPHDCRLGQLVVSLLIQRKISATIHARAKSNGAFRCTCEYPGIPGTP